MRPDPDRRALLLAGLGGASSVAAAIQAQAQTLAPAAAAVRWHSFGYRGHDTAFEAPLPAGHYRNPILTGFQPDPSILRVGNDFYLVSSTFAYFPGLPILHSRDLVNWRLLGHAVDRPGQLSYAGLGVSRGLFAPALSHHRGLFYLLCTMVDGGGNFLLTASNPAGPWSNPQWLGFEGIDPSLYFDDDGRAWMLNNGAPEGPPRYSGHRAIWQQQFDVATRKLVGPRRVIVDGGANPADRPVWIEGPHLFKREGWYYLSAAEGGTSVQHSQVIFRSRSVTGPFEPWDHNPILTQRDLDGSAPGAITCTGHAQLVIGPDGQWWATFLGCRPAAGGFWLTGRETFLLPVHWTPDGWPLILPPGQRVAAVLPAPAGASVTATALPLNGNFSILEDFMRAPPSAAWFSLRGAARPAWTAADGGLWQWPGADGLSGRGAPALLARRVQHARFGATAALEMPLDAGISAGLVLFQSEAQHVFLAVQRAQVRLEICRDGQTAVLAQAALAAGGGRVELKLECNGSHMALAFATTPGEWQTLPLELPARDFSVQAAGGGLHFTGAVVGMHARLG